MFAGAGLVFTSAAHDHSHERNAFTPDTIPWGPAPPVVRPGAQLLTASSYEGNTPGARITILLHELGHIIGRLPEDDDSWDGRSSRNTSEVQRHCKAESLAAARNSSRGSMGRLP